MMAVVQGDVTFKVKVIMDDTEPVLVSREGMRVDPQSAQKAHRKALRRSRIIAGHSYAFTGSVFEDTTHLPAKGHRWTGLRDYTGPDYAEPVQAPPVGEGKVHGRELAWAVIDDVVHVPPPARKWEGAPQPAERLEHLMAEIRNPSVLPVTLTGDEISSTTLPDMVPAAVLARRPPAHIPTPTDLDDGLFLDAEPTGSIVRRS